MPGAIFAIATIAASVTASAVLSTVIFYGVVIGAYVGIAIGVNLLTQALLPKPAEPRPEDVQQSLRQTLAPRVRYYGRMKVSGSWLFGETHEGNFHKVLALAHTEIDAIESLWVDDNEVTLDGSGYVTTSPYNSKVQIATTLGLATETAFAGLVSTFTEYTTAHRGDGIAQLYARHLPVGQSDYLRIFPNGINTQYRAVIRGAKVTNPVTDAVAWDDNAASVIMDYLQHADGMRLPAALFQTTQAVAGWQTAFNRCDDAIDLDAGGTEDRYRLWGGYSLQERPGDVLARMLVCCDGRLAPTPDGGVTLDIGQWAEPTVILDEDDIIDMADISTGIDGVQRANTIKATYLEPDPDYVTGDADPWVDAADVTARGEVVHDTAYSMSPSHTQTRRLMKLRWYRLNPAWTGKFTLNMKGLACVGERFVRLQVADFGIDDVFEIQDLDFNIGEGGILQGVTISVIAIPEAAFSWDETLEDGTPPGSTETTSNSTVPVPTNFTVDIDRLTVGGQQVPFAVLEFDAPPSLALATQAEYKLGSSSDWAALSVSEGAEITQTPALSDGVEYDFRVRHVTLTLRASEWSTTISVTPTADETAPDAVSSVGAVGGSGEVDLTWTTPNNGNFSRTLIRRHTADVEGSATLIATIYGPASTATAYTDDSLAADDYYYWITAANASGVESTSVATGAVTVS
tara:strand:+ start:25852 stop:27912 length:2061 start_codon:yes stop_codon:yes gene_type:complete